MSHLAWWVSWRWERFYSTQLTVGLQVASWLGRCTLPVSHRSHAAWAMHAHLREHRHMQGTQVHSSTQHSQSSACPLQAAAHSRAPCQSTAERSCEQGWLGGNRGTAGTCASANLAGQTSVTSAAVCRMHALSHNCCAAHLCGVTVHQHTPLPRCRRHLRHRLQAADLIVAAQHRHAAWMGWGWMEQAWDGTEDPYNLQRAATCNCC